MQVKSELTFFEYRADNLECWAKTMELKFDEETGRSRLPPGFDARVPGFGDTRTIEFIDPSWAAWSLGNIGHYLDNFVKSITYCTQLL